MPCNRQWAFLQSAFFVFVFDGLFHDEQRKSRFVLDEGWLVMVVVLVMVLMHVGGGWVGALVTEGKAKTEEQQQHHHHHHQWQQHHQKDKRRRDNEGRAKYIWRMQRCRAWGGVIGGAKCGLSSECSKRRRRAKREGQKKKKRKESKNEIIVPCVH